MDDKNYIRREGHELSLNLASIVYDATETNLNFSSTNLAQDVSQTNIKKEINITKTSY